MSSLYSIPQYNTQYWLDDKNVPNTYNIETLFNEDNYNQENENKLYYIPRKYGSKLFGDYATSIMPTLPLNTSKYKELYRQLQRLEHNANLMEVKRRLVMDEIKRLHAIEEKYKDSLYKNSKITEQSKITINNIQEKLKELNNLENDIFEKFYIEYKENENRKFNQTQLVNNNFSNITTTSTLKTTISTTTEKINDPTTDLPNNTTTTCHFPKKRDFNINNIQQNNYTLKMVNNKFMERREISEFDRILDSFIENAQRLQIFSSMVKNAQRFTIPVNNSINEHMPALTNKISEISYTNNNTDKIKQINKLLKINEKSKTNDIKLSITKLKNINKSSTAKIIKQNKEKSLTTTETTDNNSPQYIINLNKNEKPPKTIKLVIKLNDTSELMKNNDQLNKVYTLRKSKQRKIEKQIPVENIKNEKTKNNTAYKKISKTLKLFIKLNNSKPLTEPNVDGVEKLDKKENQKLKIFNKYDLLLSLYNKTRIPSLIKSYKDKIIENNNSTGENIQKLVLMPLKFKNVDNIEPADNDEDDDASKYSEQSQQTSYNNNNYENKLPINVTALINYNGSDVIIGGTFYLKTFNKTEPDN